LVGNIANLTNASVFLAIEVEVTKDWEIPSARQTTLSLAGVGHFKIAMERIHAQDLLPLIDMS